MKSKFIASGDGTVHTYLLLYRQLLHFYFHVQFTLIQVNRTLNIEQEQNNLAKQCIHKYFFFHQNFIESSAHLIHKYNAHTLELYEPIECVYFVFALLCWSQFTLEFCLFFFFFILRAIYKPLWAVNLNWNFHFSHEIEIIP